MSKTYRIKPVKWIRSQPNVRVAYKESPCFFACVKADGDGKWYVINPKLRAFEKGPFDSPEEAEKCAEEENREFLLMFMIEEDAK